MYQDICYGYVILKTRLLMWWIECQLIWIKGNEGDMYPWKHIFQIRLKVVASFMQLAVSRIYSCFQWYMNIYVSLTLNITWHTKCKKPVESEASSKSMQAEKSRDNKNLAFSVAI